MNQPFGQISYLNCSFQILNPGSTGCSFLNLSCHVRTELEMQRVPTGQLTQVVAQVGIIYILLPEESLRVFRGENLERGRHDYLPVPFFRKLAFPGERITGEDDAEQVGGQKEEFPVECVIDLGV